MASGDLAMGDKAPPWAPPPLISFANSSCASGRRFRSFGSRAIPAEGKETSEEPQAAPVSDSEKNREIADKKEEPLASPKKIVPNEQAPLHQDSSSSQGQQNSIVDVRVDEHAKTEAGEVPEAEIKSEPVTKVEAGNIEIKVNDFEEGELPAESGVNMMDVDQPMKIEDEELEDGELPSEEAADLMQRNATPVQETEVETEVKTELKTNPILGIINSAFDTALEEPEYTLAEWHEHITTGKPLPRKDVPVNENTPNNTTTKKKKKRKRSRNANKEPDSKKPKTDTGSQKTGSVQAKKMVANPAAKLKPQVTPSVTSKVPSISNNPASKVPSISSNPASKVPSISNNPASNVPSINNSSAFINNNPEPVSTKPVEEKKAEVPEKEMTLTMLIEKQLGIWQDPVEEKEKKKRVLTAERRKKKKANERIKRAEKDRMNGVARRRPVVFKQLERPLQICKYFLKGRCTKGEDCTFSHEATPETKQYLCKYFLTHCCLKGADCPFSHEPANFPCKFLVTRGFCKDGDNCRFSHKPISVEERDKLLKRVLSEQKEHEAKVYEEPIDALNAAGGGGGESTEYEPDFPTKQDSDAGYEPWKSSSDEGYDPGPVPARDDEPSYSTAEDGGSKWWDYFNRPEDQRQAVFEAGSSSSSTNAMDLLKQSLMESPGTFF